MTGAVVADAEEVTELIEEARPGVLVAGREVAGKGVAEGAGGRDEVVEGLAEDDGVEEGERGPGLGQDGGGDVGVVGQRGAEGGRLG